MSNTPRNPRWFNRYASWVAVLLWFSSCTKMNQTQRTDSATMYNYVRIYADQRADWTDTSYEINAFAAFRDNITNQLAAMNGLIINSRNISADADHGFGFRYTDTTAALLAEGLALYGTDVKIMVTGSSAADTLTKMIYLPKRVFKTMPDFPRGTLDIGGPLTINWVPDPLNSSGNVVITITYSAGMSRFLSDSTLPAQDLVATFTVPDNGTYTLTAANLQQFQKKSYVWIELRRGIQLDGVLPISHRHVFYLTVSSESSAPIYLVCLANWRNTATPLRCQVNGNRLNTGYQEQEQKDVAACSATFNQTKWVQTGLNESACPLQ
jgi:hypothetical protein